MVRFILYINTFDVLAESSVSRFSVATVPSTLTFTDAHTASLRQSWMAPEHKRVLSRPRQLSMQAPWAQGASLNTSFSAHGKSSPAKGPSGPCSTRTSFSEPTASAAPSGVDAAALATSRREEKRRR